jgi:5-formyltetrahydrofolate cyclo-ligase
MLCSKPEVRGRLRRHRRALGGLAQRLAARRLARALARHPWFAAADAVAGYIAADGEIDPAPLLRVALALGKQVYLPVLRDGDHLLFGRYRRGQRMRRNRFGISEPIGERRPPWALDLVLLPLVGFDRLGGRLGMGGGFYDRSFAFLRADRRRSPRLLGLAHHFQEVAQLPREPWDVPLAAVVTDRGWIKMRGR